MIMVASPEYIENTVAELYKAADANLATAGRLGNLIDIDPQSGDDVMLTGDLHGHRRNFNLIRRIAALETLPRRHLVLQEVCHGGPAYPQNGGCMSHSILEDIARLKVRYPDRVHFLLGNHELAELTDYPIQKNRQMLNVLFRMGLEQMYGPDSERMREALLAFLRSCPLAVRIAGGVFVCHSIPEGIDERLFDQTIFTRPMDPLEFYERGDIFHLVWGRDHRPENARAFAELMGARVLIHGHEPCQEGFDVPNPHQIILDCCGDQACYVVLPTDREWTQTEVVQRIQRLA
ncbi:MAG: metallophosphoesterase [Thermoguttaceae bacterium]